jgi:hypothetical protein
LPACYSLVAGGIPIFWNSTDASGVWGLIQPNEVQTGRFVFDDRLPMAPLRQLQ